MLETLREPMERNLVSTIIPVFNRAGMLREAVGSVLAQTYRPIEILIVDDGSTDDTAEVADELARAHPGEVHAQHGSNRGPGVSRELGRQAARGEFIQYLDSDDLLLPEKFEVEVAALREHPEAGIAYGRTRLVDESGAVLQEPYKWTGRALPTLFPGLLVDRWWNTHTPLFRRSVCDAIGPWSDMSMGEDWEYDARAGALGTRLVHCDVCLSYTRKHQSARLTRARLDASKIRDIARLNQTLFRCASKAGVGLDTPEMRHFARAAFLVARLAGSAGLGSEAKRAFELAVSATEPAQRNRSALLVYRTLASILGWTLAGRLALLLDRIPRAPGPYTLLKSIESR